VAPIGYFPRNPAADLAATAKAAVFFTAVVRKAALDRIPVLTRNTILEASLARPNQGRARNNQPGMNRISSEYVISG
jgi:hypothetical protein